jgi:CHAT domain-containing protein
MRLRPEAQLKVEPLADFEVIRIAAHGIASPKIPRPRSFSEMSPKSDEDGLLQVREIRDLNLAADLVTLSACDTGVGPWRVRRASPTSSARSYLRARS